MVIRVKNWAQFQHFKDRKPIWIKLYRELLDDIQWHELDAKSSKVLVMLWLLASENDGNLPDIKTISFRLRMSESEINACVSRLSHYLEQDDISTISTQYQDDYLEKRREETDNKKTKSKKIVVDRPDDVSETVWNDWVIHRKAKDATITETVINNIRSESQKAGISFQSALELMCVRNWQGFKSDWVKNTPLNNENNMMRRAI